MRYAKLEKNSVANGPGIRVVLWCQGCSLHCRSCHNQSTWDAEGGMEFTDDVLSQIYTELEKPWVQGLTFSGGHPLEAYNRDDCAEVAKKVKAKFPDKDIWLYTGWLFEDVKDFNIMNYVDVVVDGPYIEAERNIMLPYAGSNNQRVIDVQASKHTNTIVEYCKS